MKFGFLTDRLSTNQRLWLTWGETNTLHAENAIDEEPPDASYECGLSWLHSGPDDPFLPACKLHDQLYLWHEYQRDDKVLELMKPYRLYEATRKNADLCLLYEMNSIASWNLKLRAKAALYYGLVRAFGWSVW